MPFWYALPYEIQQIIVSEVVTGFDTSHQVLNILLVSRHVHDALVGAPKRGVPLHFGLFRLLFHRLFDSEAPIRRMGVHPDLTNEILADVWKRRCFILNRVANRTWLQLIAAGQLNPGILSGLLLEIYFMLLDDDGANMIQLERANTANFLKEVMLMYLRDQDENGWPNETLQLQLAAAGFSIISDRASVLLEGEESERIVNALTAVHVAPHRYPFTLIPVTTIDANEVYELGHPAMTIPSIANMPVAEPLEVKYFGFELTLVPPLLSPSITSIIVNRKEQQEMAHHPLFPENRAEANSRGLVGATKADWAEINLLRRLAIGSEVPRAGSGRENLSHLPNALLGSERWDHMFRRMSVVGNLLDNPDNPTAWFDTMYEPGMFSGNWLGRIMYLDWTFHNRMLEMHPQSFSAVAAEVGDPYMSIFIFQATLKEHVSEDHHVGLAGGQGVDNVYFPFPIDHRTPMETIRRTRNSVLVTDPTELSENTIKEYHDWDANPEAMRRYPKAHPESEDVEMEFEREGVGSSVPGIDIIVTGETDYLHGLAWGNYLFYGRVRKLDGLLVLVRVPQDPEAGLGRWVFSGYVYLANTIIGFWRQSGVPVGAVGMQGSFMISKVGPEIQINDNSL